MHPELDHHFDDPHDTHPTNYHEHAILKSVRKNEENDSLEHAAAKHTGIIMGHPEYHHVETHYEIPHHTRYRELEHRFDHRHDIEPFEFHDHSIYEAFEYGAKDENYLGFEEAAEKPSPTITSHQTYHPTHHYETHHIHPELYHHFDHPHDWQPFEFHDHAIHEAFDYGKKKQSNEIDENQFNISMQL